MNDNSATATPARIRTAMVDQLLSSGLVNTVAVEAAMRDVGRHLFVPDVSIEKAYALHEAVVTHRNAEGIAISSASAPGVVAGMLEQLDVQPGHRALEVGAGTGYNAALLAHLVGKGGHVTTIDIDEDVVAGARRGLAASGYENVRVICGDGEYGYPDHAPYDRIIVTAGAWDVPPAWRDQLAPGGRLVVPLRMRGLTRSIAFEHEEGHLVSRSIEECGFMPVRGAGGMAEHNILLGANADVLLRIDDGRSADAEALGQALDHHSAALCWTGVAVPAGPFGHLDFWLATMDGFCRLILLSRAAIDRGFVPPAFEWGSMAVFDQETFAYLTRRPSGGGDPERPLFELGVCAYGPGSEDLASRVADRVRGWDRERGSMTRLWIEVHPADTDTCPPGRLIIDKRHTRIVVRTA